MILPKQFFQADAAGGFVVAVFDDDGAVEMHAGLGGGAFDDGFAAADYNCVPGHDDAMNSPLTAS